MSIPNLIEERRSEINRYFDPSQRLEGSEEILFSPAREFRVEVIIYQQAKPGVNWQVIKVEVIEQASEQILFSFFSNHSHFIHHWLTIDDIHYLLCAEDIYGGQTIIDLTNKKMASYSPNEEGFIAVEYFPSPDKSLLAIIGCVWACPYVLKVVKLGNRLHLPLQQVMEIEVNDYLCDELVWLNDEIIEFRNSAGKRTYAVNAWTREQCFEE